MSDFESIRNLKPQAIIPTQNDLTSRQEQIFDLYNNPEVGLTGIKEFIRKLESYGYDFTEKEIKEVLLGNNAYNQNQRHIETKKFSSYEAHRPFQVLHIDLIFVKEWEADNGGYGVILTAIDTFTRFAWSYFQKSKSAEDTKQSLEYLFSEIDQINQYLRTNNKVLQIVCDEGKEFYNSTVKNYLKSKNVLLYSPKSKYKAAIVERFNRTLKERFIAYTTATQSRKYIDVLLDIIRNYNNSYHSTIGMTPREALEHLEETKIPQYPDQKKAKYKFKVGDFVRVVQDKKPGFSKTIHQENYSIEVFIINRIVKYQNIKKYYIIDLEGDVLNQTLYDEDLVLVDKHRIENGFNYYIIKDNPRQRRRLMGIVGYDDRKFFRWESY